MDPTQRATSKWVLLVLTTLLLVLSACNLGAGTPEPVNITDVPTNTVAPTRTLFPSNDAASPTPFQLPTQNSNFSATSVAVLPATIPPRPTNTTTPTSILILSPTPGNVLAGNVQILGSAIIPNFLQYRVEFGPDPNPGNLWFPITGVVQTPVYNGILGVWNTNTTAAPDGTYQLRLRVFSQDGREQATYVGNIRVQNSAPTPIPTNTPNVPRPIAAFTQDFTTGNAPLVVRFTNLSQGQINSFSWNFGDQSSSAERNPIHKFSNPGIYTVTLTVVGPGGSANVSRQIDVKSVTAPVANFTPSETSGESPLTVNFTNQTQGTVTAYKWNFGDGEGQTSTDVNPSYTFTKEGTYNVILEATGPGGTSTAVRQITVEDPAVPAPVAGISASALNGEIPFTVDFSSTSDGQINTYLWDFDGDGITDSTDENPTHTYQNAGEYTVKLTVIGPGGQDSEQGTITAVKPPDAPTASFNASPESGDKPLNVTFNNTSTGDVTTYEWDLDGDTVVDSTETSPSFSYAEEGTYVVTLKAIGPGGSTTAQKNITVTTPLAAPVADFTVSTEVGEAPLEVTFTNQSEGDELTYAWDFNNDGIVDSTEPGPHTITYDTPGSYTAKLSLTNSVGQDEATKQITVSESVVYVPPTAAFTAIPETGVVPLTVQFNNQSFGDIESYEWDFNEDGAPDSTEVNPSFTFDTVGEYNVKLTAIGPGGQNDAFLLVTVTPPAPTAGFTVNTNSGDAPLSVTFTNTSTGDISTYAWDFNGDSIVDNTDPGPHTVPFNTPGNFAPTLTVTGPGGSNTFTGSITVTQPADAPVAGFTVDTNSGDAPLTVTFSNTSTGDITTYEWDFNGDTVVDNTGPGPHTVPFNTPGTFSPTLKVTGPGGTNTFTGSITVTQPADAPVAGFTVDTNSGDAPLTVTFSNTSTGDITTYEWDFNGDTVVDNTGPGPHTVPFNTPGNFAPTLTVTGPGGSNTFTGSITVTQPAVAPVAGFTVDTNSGDAPLTVTFSNTSTGDITTYEWDFNGDTVVDNTGPGPHTVPFNTPGNFAPTLTVTGPGGSNTFTGSITVTQPAAAPVAGFTVDTNSGDAPLTVTFSNTSTGDISTYEWDFNGDTVVDNTGPGPHTVPFNTPGNFAPTLTVTGPGGSNTFTGSITVNQPAAAPVAGFTVDTNSGDAPLTVTFSNTSTGDISTYEWDFNGDTVVDNTGPGPHTVPFNTPGNFAPTLTVTGPGGSNTFTGSITVTQPADAPVAGFTVDTNSGDAPLTVTFSNTSTGDISTYEWDFNGDTVVDNTGPGPHTVPFNTPGNFAPTLTVTGPGGSNTFTGSITVNQPAAAGPGDIVFSTNRDGNYEIYAMNTDGSNAQNLTNHPANDTEPVWSPDGSKIAFVSDRDGNTEIYVLNVSDLSVVNVTNNPGFADFSPAWSPDGSKIAFVSDRAGDNDVFTMNADGSNQVVLAGEATDDINPVWSQDGNQVAIASGSADSHEIVIVNVADGTVAATLASDPAADDTQPAWSPDGSKIAFVSTRAGDNDIFVMNAIDGSNLVQITFDGANDQQPAWSSDNSQIVFTSDRVTAENNIYRASSADGSGITQLTNTPQDDQNAHWKP